MYKKTENFQPLVTIGLPVYNGEKFLAQALDSLLAQDYENTELIISDNASTDATQEICLEYASKDRRVHYYHNEVNLGAPKNFRQVFDFSSGKYFMWAADHDIWDPKFLSRCVEILEGDLSVVLCCPQVAWINTDSKVLEIIPTHFDTRELNRISRFHTVIWGLAYSYQIYGLVRSSALKSLRLDKDTIGGDVILLAELSLLGSFAYVPELLFYLRKMSDFGSWISYVKKHNKHLTRWSAYYYYWQMIYNHLLIVNTHVRSLPGKAILMLSVLICMKIKYRGILDGLIDQAGKTKLKSTIKG